MKEAAVKKIAAHVADKSMIAPGIYSMVLSCDIGSRALPGQFVLVYSRDGSHLLGRPICIADADDDSIRIVFRASGSGTKDIAETGIGDRLFVEGPLGRGYPVSDEITGGRSIVLLGGGIGAPSLLFLAKSLRRQDPGADILAVLGYRDSSMKHFLYEDIKDTGADALIATDDGSEGIGGNVIDALKTTDRKADVIYACGPMPMLSAVKKYAKETGAKAYISLEEHMACGVGVCLGCVVKTLKKDGHSMVNNARICTEGPVFDAEDVDI